MIDRGASVIRIIGEGGVGAFTSKHLYRPHHQNLTQFLRPSAAGTRPRQNGIIVINAKNYADPDRGLVWADPP